MPRPVAPDSAQADAPRARRLATQLRANLARRKAQARAAAPDAAEWPRAAPAHPTPTLSKPDADG